MIKVELSKNLKAKTDESDLGFGRHFTDHMFVMDYSKEKGWHGARVVPYGNFQIDPAAMVFHYGQEIFEGLKAFWDKDENITMFRPQENLARMNRSAERMCIPQFDEDLVLEGLKQLVKIDKDWIPKSEGTALYIRPTIICTDPFLGVRAGDNYIFYIILSPVGAYYSKGFAPVSLYVEEFYTRSSQGGTGEAKCGGNYAASLMAGEKAKKKGFDQVLWLDSSEKKYVEEVGSMNIFFVIDGEVVTPSLDGTILPGITRKSIIELLKKDGYIVTERKVSIDEIVSAAEFGKLNEAFGTGTAAVISPVGSLSYKDQSFTINNNEVGAITKMLYDKLTGIQKDIYKDENNWLVKIKV